MPQPIEAMLARWPFLYPEITDADEQNGNDPDNDAAKVRRQVIAPILESQDLLHAFEEKREEYSRWLRLPGVRRNWDLENPAGPGGPEGRRPHCRLQRPPGTAGGCEHQGLPGKRQAQEDRQKVNDPLPGDMAPGVVGENSPPDDQQRAVQRRDSRAPGNRGRGEGQHRDPGKMGFPVRPGRLLGRGILRAALDEAGGHPGMMSSRCP